MKTFSRAGFNISDFRKLAKQARAELKRDPRQAVEKAYLAAVHAARQVIACSGVEWKRRAQSSAAIGRASQILGERKLMADPRAKSVTRAFSLALGQHSACFYEGACLPDVARLTVKAVERAVKDLPHVCARLE